MHGLEIGGEPSVPCRGDSRGSRAEVVGAGELQPQISYLAQGRELYFEVHPESNLRLPGDVGHHVLTFWETGFPRSRQPFQDLSG
jgi:hypothetical protein